MTVVTELYESGELAQAIDAGLTEVKSKPTDVTARYRLVLLLCYNGELERADRQLTILSTQHPEAAVGTALLRQLIRAEQSRLEFHSMGRVPEFMAEPNDLMKLHLKASICIREGESEEASKLLGQAEECRPRRSGDCDGNAFDDCRELDDLFAPILEVLTSTGKYYWIPWSDVVSVEFQKPECLADLLWRPMQLDIRNQSPGAVYCPTVYVGSAQADDEALRLGRKTEWVGLDQPPVRGLGQKMLLLGEEAKSILDIGRLKFNPDD
jgi:type VI secretion system protein ImpE